MKIPGDTTCVMRWGILPETAPKIRMVRSEEDKPREEEDEEDREEAAGLLLVEQEVPTQTL